MKSFKQLISEYSINNSQMIGNLGGGNNNDNWNINTNQNDDDDDDDLPNENVRKAEEFVKKHMIASHGVTPITLKSDNHLYEYKSIEHAMSAYVSTAWGVNVLYGNAPHNADPHSSDDTEEILAIRTHLAPFRDALQSAHSSSFDHEYNNVPKFKQSVDSISRHFNTPKEEINHALGNFVFDAHRMHIHNNFSPKLQELGDSFKEKLSDLFLSHYQTHNGHELSLVFNGGMIPGHAAIKSLDPNYDPDSET